MVEESSHIMIMNNTFARSCFLLFAALAILTGYQPLAYAVDPPRIASLDDFQRDTMRGEPPTQKQIEGAFLECLKQLDEEGAELGSKNLYRRDNTNAQTAVCKKNRTTCIANPRSLDCRAFVDDYSSE